MEKWKIARLVFTVVILAFIWSTISEAKTSIEVLDFDTETKQYLLGALGLLLVMWFGEKILTLPRSIKKRKFRDGFKPLHLHQNIALGADDTIWLKDKDGKERYIEAQEIDFFDTMHNLTAYTEVGAAFPIVLNDPEKTDFTIVFHRYFEPTRLGRDRNKKDRDAFHSLFYDWLKKRNPPTKS